MRHKQPPKIFALYVWLVMIVAMVIAPWAMYLFVPWDPVAGKLMHYLLMGVTVAAVSSFLEIMAPQAKSATQLIGVLAPACFAIYGLLCVRPWKTAATCNDIVVVVACAVVSVGCLVMAIRRALRLLGQSCVFDGPGSRDPGHN